MTSIVLTPRGFKWTDPGHISSARRTSRFDPVESLDGIQSRISGVTVRDDQPGGFRVSIRMAPSSFLALLPAEYLAALLAAGELVSFTADEVLIDEGAVDDGVFLLLNSYVKVTGRTGGPRPFSRSAARGT